jgi:hypothetical protein
MPWSNSVGRAPKVTTRDVVIHTNQNILSLPNNALKAFPAPPDPFHLGHDLWIGKIDAGAAKIVLNLGEPNYFGTPKPVIQFAAVWFL